MTDKQRAVLDKYFKKVDYDSIPFGSTREGYLKSVQRLANVANKRYRRLQKATDTGRLREDRHSGKLYERAREYYQKVTGSHSTIISTGKLIYRNIGIRQLRALEKEILHFLQSESSTVRGAMEIEHRRERALKDRYGLDINKLPSETVNRLFQVLHYMQDKNIVQGMSSGQELRVLAEAAHSGTGAEAMERIFAETGKVFPNVVENADFIIQMVRASNLPPEDRKKLYKKALELKHKQQTEKKEEIKTIKQAKVW